MNGWKETLRRSLRTFGQAALGYILANIAGLVGKGQSLGQDALATLLIAAVAAGLAALMNLPSATSKTEDVEIEFVPDGFELDYDEDEEDDDDDEEEDEEDV